MGLFEFESDYDSKYLRVIPYLHTKNIFELSQNVSVLFIDKHKNEIFLEKVKRRNVYARHSWENNFYVDRVTHFSEKTVISIIKSGTPQDIQTSAWELSVFIEQLIIIATIFSLNRKSLQRKFFSTLDTDYDFAYSQDMKYLKSRTLSKKREQIIIDAQFIKRFKKLGFFEVFNYYQESSELAERIKKCITWLYESRVEKNLNAAVVKTAIALESLLIFSDSESLSKSLSERTAFLLTDDPKLRKKISKIVSEFYNARSGVVHGGKKRLKSINENIIESMDRLLSLLILLICSNKSIWSSNESLRIWCDNQKWGMPYDKVQVCYSKSYLISAINLSKISFNK